LVDPGDAVGRAGTLRSARTVDTATGDEEEADMYVVVQHRIVDPDVAFTRGRRLMTGDGAPAGVRVLQFYPSRDRSAVTCLWEAGGVDEVQRYVDRTLGDASENAFYEVDTEQAFAERPLGLPETAGIGV
jgi:hypothetical protein